MKWEKLITLIITIIPLSIVVFNNSIQFYEKLFTPTINLNLVTAFLFIIGVITFYIIINRK